jgi:hypothetical protein
LMVFSELPLSKRRYLKNISRSGSLPFIVQAFS